MQPKNSGLSYVFNVSDAIKYGLEEAIMLHNFKFWIAKNKANRKHYHEGRYWTYNSAKAFKKLFPFWSERKIYRIVNSLIEKGALIDGNFNDRKYNRTKWYALKDEKTLPI